MLHRAVAGVLCLSLVASARADDVIPGHTIDRPVNGGITGVAMAIGFVAQLIPLRHRDLWKVELTSFDESVRLNYSPRAAAMSDALFGLSIATPALYLM